MPTVRFVIVSLLAGRFFKKLLWPVTALGSKISFLQSEGDKEKSRLALLPVTSQIFKSRQVKHGPFISMEYGSLSVTGSSIFPKLLGSYEREIHHFLEYAFSQSYSYIVNIGCDEGYYAVGLALRFRGTPVLAYDINPGALQLAASLSRINGVSSQIRFRKEFKPSDAVEFKDERNLFIIDIEGAEAEIFSVQNAGCFSKSDLLIELHLEQYPELIQKFEGLFGSTHNISVVDSVPDHLKAMHYQYPELQNLSYRQRRHLLAERNEFMQWIFLASKN